MLRLRTVAKLVKFFLTATIVLSALVAWSLALIGQYGQVELLVQRGRNVRLFVFENCVTFYGWNGKDVRSSGNIASGIHLNWSPPTLVGVKWIVPGMGWDRPPGGFSVVVSHWLLSLSTGALALGVLGRSLARRWSARRALIGHWCPNCGYDLRASPDRCPECGRAVANGEARGGTTLSGGAA